MVIMRLWVGLERKSKLLGGRCANKIICILKVPCGYNGVLQQACKAQVQRIQELLVCEYCHGQVGIIKTLPQDLGSAAGFSSLREAWQGYKPLGLKYQLRFRE